MTYSESSNLPITALAETPQGYRPRAWWSVTEQKGAGTKLFACLVVSLAYLPELVFCSIKDSCAVSHCGLEFF